MKKLLKLNNKGMTAIEILVCFVLVVVISTSMYTSVSAYQNKQQILSFKEKIYTYKNLLTKEINDDIIKKGLVSVKIDPFTETSDVYKAQMNLRDGSTRCLKVTRKLAYDYLHEFTPGDDGIDDEFMIEYGGCTATGDADGVEYPIPDLGFSENAAGKKIYDFRINNVNMYTQDNVFYIYIGFYHPDLGTRYGINVVAPINYV